MPGLPGAACTSSTSGSRDRARARACSRPPVPMTRAFTGASLGGRGSAVALRCRPTRSRRCRPRPVAQDRVVGQLDAVDHPGRVEDHDVALGLVVVLGVVISSQPATSSRLPFQTDIGLCGSSLGPATVTTQVVAAPAPAPSRARDLLAQPVAPGEPPARPVGGVAVRHEEVAHPGAVPGQRRASRRRGSGSTSPRRSSAAGPSAFARALAASASGRTAAGWPGTSASAVAVAGASVSRTKSSGVRTGNRGTVWPRRSVDVPSGSTNETAMPRTSGASSLASGRPLPFDQRTRIGTGSPWRCPARQRAAASGVAVKVPE